MEGKLFIAYPEAMKILRSKWNATIDDLAMWIFLGPEFGGLIAYTDINENEYSADVTYSSVDDLNKKPREFSFAYYNCHDDYYWPLNETWFLRKDVDQFVPSDHYITGKQLLERWSKDTDIAPEAYIRKLIRESRLIDFHPTHGGTVATFGNSNGVKFPPLPSGLFSLSAIKQIEAEDGLVVELTMAKSTLTDQTAYDDTPLPTDEAFIKAGFKTKSTFIDWINYYNKVATKTKLPTIESVLIAGNRKRHYRRGDCEKLNTFYKNNLGKSVKRITKP